MNTNGYSTRVVTVTIILIISTMLTLLFIFGNSLNSSQESYEKSDKVSETIAEILTPEASPSSLSGIVRKAAHAIEFFVLGCELAGLLLCTSRLLSVCPWFHVTTPLFWALLFAVSDEFIQRFTQRTSSVKDVVIDFVGSFIGITLVCSIYFITHTIKARRQAG